MAGKMPSITTRVYRAIPLPKEDKSAGLKCDELYVDKRRMFVLLALVVIGTTIWVGIDASQREWSDGFSPAAWVLGVLLLWILVFPYYLVRRGKAPLKGSSAPAPLTQTPQYAPPTPPTPQTPQYAPLQTSSGGDGPSHSGLVAAPCVSCSGPIEPHIRTFGSTQCGSCREGGKRVLVHTESSTGPSTSQPSHTLRNVILAVSGLIVLSLVGCSMLLGSAVNSATATHTEIVHVYAPTDGCWSGAIGDSTKEGCGPADITISQSGPIAAANAQKQSDGGWELGLALEINGAIVDSSATTAEYGVAQVVGGS
jgi:hypothetical protein